MRFACRWWRQGTLAKGVAMAERIVIEEYHLTVLVPRGLPEADAEAIRRTLAGPGVRGPAAPGSQASVPQRGFVDRNGGTPGPQRP